MSVGSKLLHDRLLHLDGQIGADRRDRVANVLRRLRILLEQEVDHDLRVAVVRRADDLLDAGDSLDRSSTGLRISLSTPSGDAPG